MAIQWTRAPQDVAQQCERLFQNGGPRVYVRDEGASIYALRAECHLSAMRCADAGDVGQIVYSRRKHLGRYEWMQHEVKPTPAPAAEHPGRKLHREAHAQPKPAPDLVRSLTLTDRAGRQFVVDVEVRADLIARALGSYARENTGRLSKACDGGVIVRYVREVA